MKKETKNLKLVANLWQTKAKLDEQNEIM